LGLSIVKHIIEAHNGKIELFSEVNKGSKFRLLFPLNSR
jgi:two-component system phosphate regulon sensor histidine kinase PhoR